MVANDARALSGTLRSSVERGGRLCRAGGILGSEGRKGMVELRCGRRRRAGEGMASSGGLGAEGETMGGMGNAVGLGQGSVMQRAAALLGA